MRKIVIIATLQSLLSSCAIEFEVESQRTVLEKQILGAYEEIDDDLIMVSSVRAVDEEGNTKKIKLTALEERALKARQNQQFNQDDLKELLDKEIIGEKNNGLIALLPKNKGKSSKSKKADLDLAELIVAEENSDRRVVWQRVVEKSPDLEGKDMGLIQDNFHKQRLEKLEKGHWYESSDDKWVQKL